MRRWRLFRCGWLGRRHWLRLGGDTDLKRIDSHRLGNVLEWGLTKIADRKIEPRSHLPVGVLGQADGAGLGDSFQSRGDIDAVAHQIAVGLLDHVAEMDAYPKLDAALRRHARITLDHRVLNFDRAAHGVHHAAELDERTIARAFDDAPIVDGDGRIDQIAAQRPQPSQRPILVLAGKPTETDHVGGQDRRELPFFRHWSLYRRTI